MVPEQALDQRGHRRDDSQAPGHDRGGWTPDGKVVGVYTDGDLRRTLDSGLDPHTTPVSEAMTVGGKSITPDALAVEAMHLMQKHAIQGLLVIDGSGELVGALNFQDLLRAGVV